MALKIVRAADPILVEQIVLVLYGAPGLGKSTLGFSSAAPLLLDFDRGAYRAAIRGDSVQVDSWDDVTGITAEDLAPYKTIIADTAGRALDFLTADIIKRNPKHGKGGALTLQGYGALKSGFTAWLKMLRTMGKDVVLIAHASEEKNGDDMVERLDVQGGSKGEIYKSADAMGRLMLVSGKRVLNFSPTDTAFGKNPANLQPLMVPEIATAPHFLAEVIAAIKEKLNSLSEVQKQRQSMVADWLAKLDEAKSAEDFNRLVTDVRQADKEIQPVVKGALHKAATEAGYTYDKTAGYVGAA